MEIKNYFDLVDFPSDKFVLQGRKFLLSLYKTGVEAVNPYEIVKNALKYDPDLSTIKIRNFSHKLKTDKIWVIGVGKAVGRMAEAVEDIFPSLKLSGTICVPEGIKSSLNLNNIQALESSHPLPSKKNIENTEIVINTVKQVKPKDLVISLISGGGSALWASPIAPISLDDLRALNQVLIRSGMSIHEVNIIRKHVSNIKGGKFTKMIPCVNLSLIISDVIGDEIESIASGPFFPDSSTYLSVQKILEKYNLQNESLPSHVYNILRKGLKGEIEETPKKDNPVFHKVHNYVLGSNKIARKAISERAKGLGINVIDKEELVEKSARYVGKKLFLKSKEILQEESSVILYISGGEPIIHVLGSGIGGRNQEVVGGFLEELLKSSKNLDVALLVAGTDGIDGNSEYAGAISDSYSVQEIMKKNIKLKEFQENNDMTSFFKQVGRSVILSGPTGTNVMDIQLMLVNASKIKFFPLSE
ncbi:MAG: glycerate kinase type-2 family protein [Candidatus Hodarchaeales archaeon]|jgi:glycerate-2-kinase